MRRQDDCEKSGGAIAKNSPITLSATIERSIICFIAPRAIPSSRYSCAPAIAIWRYSGLRWALLPVSKAGASRTTWCSTASCCPRSFTIGGTCGPEFIDRSEEHTSELQSLLRISYAIICLQKKHTMYKKQK